MFWREINKRKCKDCNEPLVEVTCCCGDPHDKYVCPKGCHHDLPYNMRKSKCIIS